MQRLLGTSIFALSALIGIAAFAYPLLLPKFIVLSETGEGSPYQAAPALTLILLVLTVAVLLLEVQGQAASAKMVAALGVLVAATAVLRFIEVAVPGPGGFSPIFVPIIITGFVFGVRFGFLMGTMAIFVSALITGGIGPWLPYQMFAAGWVGLTAAWLPRLEKPVHQLAILVLFAFAWGFLYGLLMNLYFWPYMGGGITGAYDAGQTVITNLKSYAVFYAITSSVWDLSRAAGNALLMLALGLPAVRALERFRDRFQFQVVA